MKLSLLFFAAATASSCEYTSCTYTSIGDGLFRTSISTSDGEEKFSCGATADGGDCECECDDTLECTLNHLNSEGETKSIHHCAAPTFSPTSSPTLSPTIAIPDDPASDLLNTLKSMSVKLQSEWASLTPDTKDAEIGALSLPNVIMSGSDLIRLELDSKALTGSVPSYEFNTKLQRIKLKRMPNLTGPLPSFATLKSLTHLEISTNAALDGPLPDFNSNTGLQQLTIFRNEFTGSIPSFPTNIKVIDISDNELSGTVGSLEMLPRLEKLELDRNNFSGPIPTFRTDSTSSFHFTTLNLDHNQFTGTIPFYTHNGRLENLQLSSNKLTGPLPLFNQLHGVKKIDLRNNELTGSLPDLRYNSLLQRFFASGNSFIDPAGWKSGKYGMKYDSSGPLMYGVIV